MLEAVSSLFWEMLHHACLSGFASCAQMLYPPPILVLPITLNLTFLIVCSSWHLAVSHLPALKEAGCCLSVCLSVPKTLIKQLSPPCCSTARAGGWAQPLTGMAWPSLCEPGGATVCSSSAATSPFLPGGRMDIFMRCNFFHLPKAA